MNNEMWKSLIIKILLMILTPLAAQLHVTYGASDLPALATDLADILVLVYGMYRSSGMKLVPHASVMIHKDDIIGSPVVGATVALKGNIGQVVGAIAVLFLAGFAQIDPASAQIKRPQIKRPQITGNVVDDAKVNLGLAPAKPAMLTGNVEKDMTALWQKILNASNADLTYASALAGSTGTASGKIRKQCWDAILALNVQANGANLKNPDGSQMTKPDPSLFTDVETLAEVIDNLSPQGPLFTSCAGAAQLAKTNTLMFINAVVTGAAGIAALPAGL